MHPRDTTPEAAELQRQLHRELGPSGRFLAAIEISDLLREFTVAGLRQKHPELSEEQLREKLIERLYGK